MLVQLLLQLPERLNADLRSFGYVGVQPGASLGFSCMAEIRPSWTPSHREGKPLLRAFAKHKQVHSLAGSLGIHDRLDIVEGHHPASIKLRDHVANAQTSVLRRAAYGDTLDANTTLYRPAFFASVNSISRLSG